MINLRVLNIFINIFFRNISPKMRFLYKISKNLWLVVFDIFLSFFYFLLVKVFLLNWSLIFLNFGGVAWLSAVDFLLVVLEVLLVLCNSIRRVKRRTRSLIDNQGLVSSSRAIYIHTSTHVHTYTHSIDTLDRAKLLGVGSRINESKFSTLW